MKITTTLVIILCFIGNVIAQTAYTIETLPDPKDSGYGYVSNPDKIIDEETVVEINAILTRLEASTTIQIAVAVVNSIGNEVPAEFRTKLLRKWGVGQKDNNNGLLVLMVIDQRRVEFEVGYGLEGIITDIMSVRIQQEYMIPHAKEGDYSAALLAGIVQLDKILTDPQYRDEVYANSLSSSGTMAWWRDKVAEQSIWIFGGIYALILFISLKGRKNAISKTPDYVKNNYSESYAKFKIAAVNMGIPAAFITWQELAGSIRIFELAAFIYGFAMLLTIEKRLRLNRYITKDGVDKEPQATYSVFAKSYSRGWGVANFIFPFPFAFMSMATKSKMNALRNTPPQADNGKAMVKMDEKTDDGFLNAFQLKEEELKSVDYDVWIDNPTNQVKIYRFENYGSKYKACPSCGTKAYLMIKNETLVSPTYESSGTGQKTYKCKACNHVNKTTYSIAKLERSSSSGSSGSGGGGGSSWGGGSSGGGGGGSSW